MGQHPRVRLKNERSLTGTSFAFREIDVGVWISVITELVHGAVTGRAYADPVDRLTNQRVERILQCLAIVP